MCRASTSTTTPSGIRHPLTMTFLSEPSGFTERMRPWLASRKTRRAVAVLFTAARVDFKVCVSVIFALSLVVHGSIFNFQAARKSLGTSDSYFRQAVAAVACVGLVVLAKVAGR